MRANPPARVAAYLTALVGLVLFGFGVSTFARAHPPALPLSIAITLAGALETALAWFLLRRSRAAWAFAASLNGTGFVIGLFGSFKLRDVAEIPLAMASVPCFVFGAVTIMLVLAAADYERQ